MLQTWLIDQDRKRSCQASVTQVTNLFDIYFFHTFLFDSATSLTVLLLTSFLVLFSRIWVTRVTDDLTISLTLIQLIQLGWLIGLTGRHRFEHKWDKTLNSFELTPCLKFVYDIWQDFTWFDTYGQSLLEDRPWRGSYTRRGGGS